ncbi:M3 family oligoendopeptidase [Pseudalkalibacillus decolorationis]|uniref:M3 family oligoendopeptidase n=1 Tax=Pseudalkalibacillus decolorationis TaxID=163879 RepID=UPI0021494F32|nr:M3 family oligoendopeptidase [Pseudalkalibacillus decolorationis]
MEVKNKKFVRIDIVTYEDEFSKLLNQFENASTYEEQCDWFKKLNDHRFVFETAYNYVRLQHFREMNNEFYLKEFAAFNKMESRYLKLVGTYYHSILRAKFRSQLEDRWGKQLFRLAELKQNTYSSEIIVDIQKENQLIWEYETLLGNATITFSNEKMKLSELAPYLNSSDRITRKIAHEAKNQFFIEKESQFDRILDELVTTRNTIAKMLGHSSFIDLGYQRMNRTGHRPMDLTKYRNQVKKYGVPFVSQLRNNQQHRIGVEKLKYYDEGYLFADGLPSPKGSIQDILINFRRMFAELSPETKAFYDEMVSTDLMDLHTRPNKMGGNYATYIGDNKSPYLFANFHGIANDIRVFTHEAGHAFQFYMSRHWNIPEYILPYDSAELFSFTMERFVWPWMELFFGEETKRYQYSHLTTAFMYMPLASAVDEFEHYLYDQPTATIEDRKSKWRKLEIEYLPERDYDGNDFLEKGTGFYEINQLFTTPFYFMDYDLAHFCAVQLWIKHQKNPKQAWKSYLDMCRNGGKLPFHELIEKANLNLPFEESSLQPLLRYVQEWMDQVEDCII